MRARTRRRCEAEMDRSMVPVDTGAMRDVTVPRSFPEARGKLLVFIVVSALVFLGAGACLVYGFLFQWPAGVLVVLAALVCILGVGLAVRTWIFLRLRSEEATSRGHHGRS
ncbi:hypothetical protein GCM10025760_33240 [Microbacterium yannicii]|uniref:Uncharacterized protein n=2 Tax=Microbacterium yannicii TaxID=671622 RepID=A0ABP9MMN2_9MICO